MSQVLLLGISGLDADLLRVYGPSLPNLRRLMLESPFLDLHSTIPPEPAPAWVSVYSGLNPANHGMLAGMDCLERTIPNAHLFQEELFWERAARAGKQVCVLNPLLGAEQKIEGLMCVPPTPYPGQGQSIQLYSETFPSLLDEPLIPPSCQLATFCNTLRERTERQVAKGLDLLAQAPWDLFFLQLDALDHVQHFLWRYSDPGDPMYPGRNEHAYRILEFYQFFDTIVGRFRAAIHGSDYMLGVVSSHGHERRCVYRLHINEWLREQLFLTLSGQNRSPIGQKGAGLPGVEHLRALASWFAQYLPRNKRTANQRHSIDPTQTVAQLVELASTTSSYGGITINRALLEREQRSYELVCEAIITGLGRLRLKENAVVHWVKKREQCYQGKYLERYPDILFELRGDFGVGRSLYTPLIVADSTHRLISGTHNSHGVFLLENWPLHLETYEDFQTPSVIDVAPTILHLLGVDYGALDGHPLVQPHLIRQLI